MSRRRRWLGVAFALTVGAGCSSSPGPDVIGAGPNQGAGVAQAALTPDAVSGYGRAKAGVASGDRLVTVTTRGVFRVDAADAEPVAVAEVASSTDGGPVAVSADHTLLAVTVTAPPAVRIFDIAGGNEIATATLPDDVSIRTVTFAGDRVVVDTSAGPFAVPTAGDAQATRLAETPASGLSAVLPDGTVVVPLGGTRDIALSGIGTADRRSLAVPEDAMVLDARATRSGSTVAVTTGVGPDPFERDDTITVLDTATWSPVGSIATGRPIDPLQWLPVDGAVAIANGAELEWWADDGTRIGAATPVDSTIAGLHEVAGGLVTVYSDGTLALWSIGSLQPSVLGGGGRIVSVTVSPDGSHFVTVDEAGGIAIRSGTDGAVERVDDRFATGALTDVAIADDGRVAASSTLGSVRVFDSSLSPARPLVVVDDTVTVDTVAFDPVTGGIAAGVAQRVSESAFDDTVVAWSAADGAPVFRTGGEAEDVVGCSFFFARVRYSPDGGTMAITSHDFSIQLIDGASGALLHTIPGTTTVLDIAFTQDGTRLIGTYDDGMVKVWSTSDYSEQSSYRAALGGLFAIAPLPDDTMMAATDITGSITLLRIADGTASLTIVGAASRTSSIDVSPDGLLIAAPTDDLGVGVWSVADGSLLSRASGHTAEVTGVAFSADGTWLASSSTDGTVRTWTIAAD